MIEYLKPLKTLKWDMITFVPTDDEKMTIQGSEYNDTNFEKINGSELGDSYHVILFRENEEGETTHEEKFEAILVEPLEYISRMIDGGWYGFVMRQTNKSGIFAADIYEELCSS